MLPKHILERKKRLNNCYDYLIDNGKVDSMSKIAEDMGVADSTVRTAVHPSSRFISTNFVNQFIKTYDYVFSKAWIMEGVGKMLSSETPQPYTIKPLNTQERWQRFKFIMEQEGEDYMSLSEKMKFSSFSTVYRIVFQKTTPRESTCQKLLDLYPYYSQLWLLHGRGPIYSAQWEDAIPNLKDGDNHFTHQNASYYSNLQKMDVPFVPVHARAGILSSYEDQTFIENLEIRPVLTDRKYFGKYMLFEVEGDSMVDGSMNSLLDRDILLCREIRQDYWMHKLHTHNWPYFVFVTRTEGVVVKCIKEQKIQEGIFILSSLNTEYKDLVIDVRDVQEIYNVVQLVSRNFRN